MSASRIPDPSNGDRPIRVLNLIDALAGGGSERLLWDTVRLSDPARVRHTVSTASPDWLGDFHYADRLKTFGAYRGQVTKPGPAPNHWQHLLSGLRNFLRAQKGASGIFAPLRFCAQLIALVATFPRTLVALWRDQPDVVHTHTFFSFVHGLLVALFTRIPVVHTVPCLFSQMSDAGFGWLPWIYRRSPRFVRVYFSGASTQELRSVGIPTTQIHALRGGLDLSDLRLWRTKIAEQRTQVRIHLGLPADAVIALNIGRLHASKGQVYAIEALASLASEFPQFHLVILGEGDERATLEQQARSLGIERRVHFVGFVPDPLPFCAAADIYVRTNLLEGDNLSSTQALGLGLPAVGFDTRQEMDIIRDAPAGFLVKPKSAEALGEAIRKIIALPDGGASLGRTGMERIDARLDIRDTLDLYTSTYVRLAARPAAAPPARSRAVLLWSVKLSLTAGLLYFTLAYLLDWSSLAEASKRFPLSSLAAILGLTMVAKLVVAWQTRLALAQAGIPLTTLRVFNVHLITSFFSVVLPGELAGAAVSWHLFSKETGRRTATAAALIYLRLIGLFVFVPVGVAGIFLEPRLLALHAHWPLLAAAFGIGLPLLAFLSSRSASRLESIASALVGLFRWRRLQEIHESFWHCARDFAGLSGRIHAALWLAAALTYAINVCACLLAMQAAGIVASPLAVGWLIAVITLLSLVPFTVAGFGLRELGVAALMTQWYGVPTESAVLFSLAMGAVSIITSVIFGGAALAIETARGRRAGLPANLSNR